MRSYKGELKFYQDWKWQWYRQWPRIQIKKRNSTSVSKYREAKKPRENETELGETLN